MHTSTERPVGFLGFRYFVFLAATCEGGRLARQMRKVRPGGAEGLGRSGPAGGSLCPGFLTPRGPPCPGRMEGSRWMCSKEQVTAMVSLAIDDPVESDLMTGWSPVLGIQEA